jgi:hypothetical protein
MASGSFYARGGCWSFYTAKTHLCHSTINFAVVHNSVVTRVVC